MNDRECRERIRWLAGQAGLDVFFVEPGALETRPELGAVFTLEDFDSDLEPINTASATDVEIMAAIARARVTLGNRSGCEIVHDGAGAFRCLRHDVECDTGEERDAVIRQTLRWTAACPIGGVTQAFFLLPHRPEETT